jgi:putative NADH-flavin reductase
VVRRQLETALLHGYPVVARSDNGPVVVITCYCRCVEVSAPDDSVINARADVHDADALTRALVGADAVISALGVGTSRAPTDVYSTGVSNTLSAMESTGAAKLAVISAVPAGPWDEQPLLQRRIALPILQRFFGATYDDIRRMETILQETTDVDWISLRPPRLGGVTASRVGEP